MIVVFVFVCFHQLEGIQLVFFFVTELIFNLFFFFFNSFFFLLKYFYNRFGSIVRYGETRTFKGEGMPLHNTPSEYGNLHVEFIVDFPRHLNEKQIEQLKSVLP